MEHRGLKIRENIEIKLFVKRMINPKIKSDFKKSKNIALFLEENILTHCVVLEVAAAA